MKNPSFCGACGCTKSGWAPGARRYGLQRIFGSEAALNSESFFRQNVSGHFSAASKPFSITFAARFAGVAKLVDVPDLGSGAARHGGSSPSARTHGFRLFFGAAFFVGITRVQHFAQPLSVTARHCEAQNAEHCSSKQSHATRAIRA